MTAIATETNAPAMRIKDKSLYAGKISEQRLVEGRDNIPQLEFTIPLSGELINARKPEAGLNPCPAAVAEVILILHPTDETKLAYSMKDLFRLGFTSDDLELLDPKSKGFHNFVGKTVYVTPVTKVYNDREQVYWNFRHPRTFVNNPVGKAELKKSGVAEAYKRAVALSREEMANNPL